MQRYMICGYNLFILILLLRISTLCSQSVDEAASTMARYVGPIYSYFRVELQLLKNVLKNMLCVTVSVFVCALC